MSGEYSNMPLWKKILIYVVVGGLVYWLIYYFAFGKKGGYNYNDAYQNDTSMYDSPNTTQEVPSY